MYEKVCAEFVLSWKHFCIHDIGFLTERILLPPVLFDEFFQEEFFNSMLTVVISQKDIWFYGLAKYSTK